MEHVVNKLIF